MEGDKIDGSFLPPMREFSATDDELGVGVEERHVKNIKEKCIFIQPNSDFAFFLLAIQTVRFASGRR
jgi:hypothetical protein